MAQPVWVLSVDLQTKTATFQTGLADAAKAARGSFQDIQGGASGMGGRVSYSMSEARHSVMLLGEEFGVHIPRALATFIAGLGPIGSALEAAFPFMAIVVGATLLIQHLEKLREAGAKLTDDQVRFGTAVNNAFNTLDQKLIQAQIKSDELRNDHLGALKLQLELIDKQSMAELVHAFEEVAKAADVVMKDLEGHWYTFGIGSDGAKNALTDVKAKYENLLSQGTDAGKNDAHNLLMGTLKTAQEVLHAQQVIKANRDSGEGQTDDSHAAEAVLRAHKASLAVTDKEIAAQEAIANALQAQVGLEGQVAALKKLDSGNATKTNGKEGAAQQAAAARQSAESQLRMGEQSIAADRASADAQLTIHRASLEARLASDLDFAGRDRDVKQAANQAEIAALDKSGKDYANQLKALNDKTLEINSEYDTKVAELKAKASVAENSRDLQSFEQNEREKIEAARQGSTARLAVIDTAIKEEQSHNLQDTNFFRELLNMRVETTRQEAEEEGKLREEAGIKAAESDEKTGLLSVAAEKQQVALQNSQHLASMQQRIMEEQKLATDEYNIKLKALQQEEAALNKSGKDYNNKLKQLQDQEKQLTQQHENELASIREKAQIETNNKLAASYQQFTSTVSGELSKTIMGHQTMAKMVESLGDEMISGLIKNALQYAMSNKFRQESDARAAGSAGYKAGMEVGGPIGPVLAPIFAAAAFAGALAFEGGTDRVPGIGRGDVVPAMLSPGEGVVPGGVMDGLRNMARNGGFDQGQHYTVHVRPTYHVNTIDGDGMQAALEKHSEQLQRHFERAVRRMNR